MFHLPYVSSLNIISKPITKIFLKEGTKWATMFSELHFYSSRLLQPTYIQLHQSVICLISLGPNNNFHNVAWLTYLKFTHSMQQISWEANRVSAGQEFLAFIVNRMFIPVFIKARLLSLYWTLLHDFSQKLRFFY
jgi:hypothetical protein